ncbi:MAG: hypothetical protein AB4050_04285 [Synechococcus sp.]
MHSYSRASSGFQGHHSTSNSRYNDDFLARLEGEYWQKRINQLKYEFANSARQQLEVSDEAWNVSPESHFPLAVQPSAMQSSQPLSPSLASPVQESYIRRKSVVARPVIRRDRSMSSST